MFDALHELGLRILREEGTHPQRATRIYVFTRRSCHPSQGSVKTGVRRESRNYSRRSEISSRVKKKRGVK